MLSVPPHMIAREQVTIIVKERQASLGVAGHGDDSELRHGINNIDATNDPFRTGHGFGVAFVNHARGAELVRVTRGIGNIVFVAQEDVSDTAQSFKRLDQVLEVPRAIDQPVALLVLDEIALCAVRLFRGESAIVDTTFQMERERLSSLGQRIPLHLEGGVYFDIEDDPTQGLTYLFGMYIKEGSQTPRFHYFVARPPDEEEKTVRAFWEFLRSAGDDVYYVYSHKERTTLRHLMDRYALDSAVYEQYVAMEYDIYTKLIVEHSDWPTHSYGIKQIAKLIGFRWRDPDPSGANSIAWYNEYLADPSNDAALNRILRYNEDDCLAMVAIKEYFEQAGDSPPGEP